MKRLALLAVLVAALAGATWTSGPQAAPPAPARACVPEPIWGYYPCNGNTWMCFGIIGWYNPCGSGP